VQAKKTATPAYFAWMLKNGGGLANGKSGEKMYKVCQKIKWRQRKGSPRPKELGDLLLGGCAEKMKKRKGRSATHIGGRGSRDGVWEERREDA